MTATIINLPQGIELIDPVTREPIQQRIYTQLGPKGPVISAGMIVIQPGDGQNASTLREDARSALAIAAHLEAQEHTRIIGVREQMVEHLQASPGPTYREMADHLISLGYRQGGK